MKFDFGAYTGPDRETPSTNQTTKPLLFWARMINAYLYEQNHCLFVSKNQTSSFLCSSPQRFGSSLLLIGPPKLLFHFCWQRVEQVLLHHQSAPLQQPTLAQLHRETLQTVPSQLQLGQPGELPEARW